MLRSAAMASASALKRAFSAATRPSLNVSRSIATAPVAPPLLANLRHRIPSILFSPPPSPSSSFGGGSFRGLASRGATTTDDSGFAWREIEEVDLLGNSDYEPSDSSDESDMVDEHLGMDESDDDVDDDDDD